MPPRFKPFSSFLTQGMNNTNKNINNMNQPSNPGISNPLSKSFTGGGGGNVMGGTQGNMGGPQSGWSPMEGGQGGGNVPLGGESDEFDPYDYNQDGLVDLFDLTWLQQQEGTTAEMIQALLNYMNQTQEGGTGTGGWAMPGPVAPTEFAGGGGQGGEAAKKLYYPGTQGGFASVGSGIGGQQNMLDDLLMKLKG